MADDKPILRNLKLVVENGRVSWSLHDVNADDSSFPGGAGTEQLDLAAEARTSINELVSMFRSLGAALQSMGGDPVVVRIANFIAEKLGEELYRYLFRGRLDRIYHDEAERARQSKALPLRVLLEFHPDVAAEVVSWPWEYLRSPFSREKPFSGSCLSLETELMLSRRASATSQRLRAGATLKVLLIVAQPRDTTRRVAYEKLEEVLDRLKAESAKPESGYQIRIDYETLIQSQEVVANQQWLVTRTNMPVVIQAKIPDIVHFIGHGRLLEGYAQIELVKEAGEQDPVDDEEFARLIHHPGLKLVFLQACDSAATNPYSSAAGITRRLLNANVPAVVAMQNKVENQVATEFACAFYEGLARTRSIDVAVGLGRKAIKNLSNDCQQVAFGTPVLYLESESGRLLLAEDTQSNAPRTMVDHRSSPETPPDLLCVRCGAKLGRGPSQKRCQRCRLCFYCNCKDNAGNQHRYADPLEPSCDECGESIVQIPYDKPPVPPPAVEPPLRPTGT